MIFTIIYLLFNLDLEAERTTGQTKLSFKSGLNLKFSFHKISLLHNSVTFSKFSKLTGYLPPDNTLNYKMGDSELTVADITELGRSISKGDMESIALGYFSQDWNRVKEIKDDTRNVQEFNREILMDWKKANPGPEQKEVCKDFLCKFKCYGWCRIAKTQTAKNLRDKGEKVCKMIFRNSMFWKVF